MHSIAKHNNKLVYAKNRKLYTGITAPQELASLIVDDPVYYHALFDGEKTVTFWSNGTVRGRLVDSLNYPWKKGVNAEANTHRQQSGPMSGHIVEYGLGRMAIAKGSSIFLSEPFNPYLYDLFANRLSFESEIRFIAFVDRGFWVGDSNSIYWIRSDGNNFERVKKATFPALKQKPVAIDLNETSLDLPLYGAGYVVLTQEGFCLLGDNGFYLLFGNDKVEFREPSGKFYNWQSCGSIRMKNRVYFYANNGIGLTLNLRNFAITQHDVYPFQSFVELQGDVYGINAGGIYKIALKNKTAMFAFQSNFPAMARLRYLYIDGEFSSELNIKITGDERNTEIYTVKPRNENLKQHSFKLPVRRRNGINNHWTIEVSCGSDFSVDNIDALVETRAIYRGR